MGSNNEHHYKCNHNGVYSCKYHVVWCPKYRRKVLVNGVDERLKEIIRQIAQEFQATVIELEITPALPGTARQGGCACGASVPDHVHLLCEVDPQFGIHRFVGYLKGRSSHLLRQEFSWLCSRLPTLWSNSYFVATVGGAPLAVIKQYIENQKNV